MPRLTVWLLLVATVGLGVAIFYAAQPQDLKDLQGYRPETRALLRRDIKKMIQSSLDRKYPVTITEGEINDWLRGVIHAKQGGLLAEKVTLDGIWVRLEKGRAEIVMERKVLGKPFTVSMFVKVSQTNSDEGIRTQISLHGGPYHEMLPFPTIGGRFGQLPVPQGFLLLVMPAYKKLAGLFPEEIRLGFEEMNRIEISKGRLTLDPRSSTASAPPGTPPPQ